MAYANGKCIVTKEEGPCLVLPAGSFSPSRITFISKEGCDKLVDVMKSSDERKPGTCCINRTKYEDCVVIPRGVIGIKMGSLMSEDAIQGMSAELAKMPADISVKEEAPAPEPAPEPVLEPEPPKEEATPEPVEEPAPAPKKKKSSIKKKKSETHADPSSGDTIEAE
ncbi:MAG: hypothetical protein R3250_09425 [Melioribacteraceae bacterium]|nr:hypothetical protein [Melioribacteraceae bacterium]